MDGSESRPILFQILKGFFSWKINTFTGMYLSIDDSISFFFFWFTEYPFYLLIQLVLFLESFLKLYLKVFVLFFLFCSNSSALYFRNTIYVFAGHVFLYLTYVLFPHSCFTLFISIIFVPFLFLSSMGWLVSRSFYGAISHVTFISLMVLVFHPLFFLFLLLRLPLSVFSELL